MSDTTAGHWHLDRRVPIAMIVAIFMQTAGIVWWASNMDARLEQVEKEQTRRQTQESRLVALEVRLQAISENIVAMRRSLEMLTSDRVDRAYGGPR